MQQTEVVSGPSGKLHSLLYSIVSPMKKELEMKMINFVLLHPINCKLSSNAILKFLDQQKFL